MRADVYWHSVKKSWSLRVAGRVVDHLPTLTLQDCRMVVRETERQRCLARRQRSVHAWIQGTLVAPPRIDEPFVRIGYNPFLGEVFTRRPGFAPIHEADLVLFMPDGAAWALVESDWRPENSA